MSIHSQTVVDGKPSLAVTDRALFVGFKIPEEIKSMIQLIISTRLDRPTFQEILKGMKYFLNFQINSK